MAVPRITSAICNRVVVKAHGRCVMAFYEINTREWPLVIIRFPRVPVTDSEIDAFQARFTAVLELAKKGSARVSATKLLLAMDLNGIVDATFQMQCRAARLIHDLKPYVLGTVTCTALTVSSELVRTIFTAITTLQPLTSEHSVFEHESDAHAWLRKRCD